MINYMNRIKSLLSCVMALCVFTSCAITISAKEDISITADKTDLNIGDSVSISVEIPGDKL